MKILGISGSLREGSFNTMVLKHLGDLARDDVEFRLSGSPGKLPLFNPDQDGENPPMEVRSWREELAWADGLVIASPEYAHAISGSLKNALDWVVGSGELTDRPAMAINVSPTHLGAEKAHEALLYTLRLLSARLVEDASFRLGMINNRFNAHGKLVDPEAMELVEKSWDLFLGAVRQSLRSPVAG